ncbi:B-box zinc finger protein [Irregularibacter muris]|uniref:B-box zinc finger protein n=1 Tax=Irregularibacter muris TaxID=1796619 RepID=A0AAE3HEY9_9FIRM|nr:B-box zinc finger protein [Irregularibacter muris]MCR1898282.1 B-box zinc finger protein [Irregularibacter muris]
MECKNHRDREAIAMCISCGQPLCEQCDAIVLGKHYCEKCKDNVETREAYPTEKGKKIVSHDINNFFWFILSLVPGAGHMYMGLMKRGAIILGAFLMGVSVMNLLYFFDHIGGMLSILIYVYAFFDSYNTKKAIQRGEVVRDEGLEGLSLENINLYYVGIAIIVIGVFSLMRSVLYVGYLPEIVRIVLHGIERSVVPILFIIGGIWLIKKSKHEDEEFQEE